MHDAYEVLPVLERLPLIIECITCYEQSGKGQTSSDAVTLLVGTKPGHLLVYKVECHLASNQPDVTLEKSNRSFSKRPILQLYASYTQKILISLSDNLVSVYDLFTFQLITSMSKGALLFSADLEEQTSSTGEVAHALKLCIATKRKLQFFFWKNRDFVKLHDDVQVTEVPKCMAWCRDSVCLGFKRDYSLVKLNEGRPPTELFPTGRQAEPVMGRLEVGQLALMKDNMSIFINSNGEPTYKQSFSWSDNPLAVESQPPYLIAVLPNYVEIRTSEPRLLIQSMDFVKPRFLSGCRRWMFVSSTNSISTIRQRSVTSQIEQLVQAREFELALKLAQMASNANDAEKEERARQIRTSLAFERFCQRRFSDSLHNFAELHTDPVHVISLYPDLLPRRMQNTIPLPSPPPTIKGLELESALQALIEFLTEKRNETLKVTTVKNFPIVKGVSTEGSRVGLLQIIDTTLLKCYLKTNDALVAPLLRLPDNNCIIAETEEVLITSNKQRELIEFYRSKKMHTKALNRLLGDLRMQNNKDDVSEDMIEYLQHISGEDIEVVFEFAPHLLKLNPIGALRIFTGDTAEVESFPRDQVFHFLDGISKSLVVAYLEHVIFTWKDDSGEFHNALARAYLDRAVAASEVPGARAGGQFKVDVDEMMKRLSAFLEESEHYDAERILLDFPQDKFFKERAMLLGRMGDYQQALAIYVNTLKDYVCAERFCAKVYDLNPNPDNDVFLCLLKMYLSSSPPHRALSLMQRHPGKFDAQKTLSSLPDTVSVSTINYFLSNVLERFTDKSKRVRVLESLLLSENQQVHEHRVFHESRKCLINDERVCRVCKKKIGASAFARYPNDVVVHYYCWKDKQTSAPHSGRGQQR